MKLILSILLTSSVVWGQIISPSNVRTLKDFKNYVQNPDAEYNNKSGITDASSILTLDSSPSSVIDGKYSFSIQATASGQKVKFKLNNLPNKFVGQSGECSVYHLGNIISGDYKWYVEDASGTKISADFTQTATIGTVAKISPIIFNVGATLNNPYYLSLESFASGDDFRVDSLYCGDVTSIGQFSAVSDWQTYTPTIGSTTGFGAISAASGKWRKVGDSIEVIANFTAGTVAAAIGGITIPPGLSIDANKLSLNNTTGASGSLVGTWNNSVASGTGGFLLTAPATSTSTVYFAPYFAVAAAHALPGGVSSAIAGTGNQLFVKFTVPIQGWSASQSAAAANQTDYGDTPFAPTIGAGAGTVTANSAFHNRTSEYLNVRGSFTTGTVAASLVTITLPNSLAIDTTKISIANTSSNPGEQVGKWSCNGTNVIGQIVTATGTSSTLVYFSGNNAGGQQLTPTNTPVTSTTACSYSFRVPISGWAPNQRAPTLIGSVTSNSVSALRIEHGIYAGASRTTACTAGTCTAYDESTAGWITITFNSTGQYTWTFASGVFSSAPNCKIQHLGNFAHTTSFMTAPTATTAATVTYTPPSTLANGAFSVSCMGPR